MPDQLPSYLLQATGAEIKAMRQHGSTLTWSRGEVLGVAVSTCHSEPSLERVRDTHWQALKALTLILNMMFLLAFLVRVVKAQLSCSASWLPASFSTFATQKYIYSMELSPVFSSAFLLPSSPMHCITAVSYTHLTLPTKA